MKENKVKFALYLPPEKKAELERRYREEGFRSITAFIEKAIDFYLGYLDANSAGAFLLKEIQSAINGRLGVFEDRMAKLLYKLTVEMDMGMSAALDCIDLDTDYLRKLRANSVRNVKATNGLLTFEQKARVYGDDKDAEAVDQDATDISSLPYECWKLWIVAGDDTAPMAERDAAAAQLIEKAEGGDLHAQYLTGKLYQDGPMLIPDSVEVLYWFEQAAKQGHSAAQYAAGKILLSPDPEVHNPELGIQWLESAVQNKNSYAAYRLGKEYLKGKIVPKDTARAMDYFTRSAETGNQYAQYALGKLHLDEYDQEQAHYWFTQSAAQGNSHAQFFLNHWDDLQPPSVMLAATRLLYHMSRVFQDQTPSPPIHGGIQVDRKLMARIREKKIAMGHKPDGHEEPSQTQSMSMG